MDPTSEKKPRAKPPAKPSAEPPTAKRGAPPGGRSRLMSSKATIAARAAMRARGYVLASDISARVGVHVSNVYAAIKRHDVATTRLLSFRFVSWADYVAKVIGADAAKVLGFDATKPPPDAK